MWSDRRHSPDLAADVSIADQWVQRSNTIIVAKTSCSLARTSRAAMPRSPVVAHQQVSSLLFVGAEAGAGNTAFATRVGMLASKASLSSDQLEEQSLASDRFVLIQQADRRGRIDLGSFFGLPSPSPGRIDSS